MSHAIAISAIAIVYLCFCHFAAALPSDDVASSLFEHKLPPVKEHLAHGNRFVYNMDKVDAFGGRVRLTYDATV